MVHGAIGQNNCFHEGWSTAEIPHLHLEVGAFIFDLFTRLRAPQAPKFQHRLFFNARLGVPGTHLDQGGQVSHVEGEMHPPANADCFKRFCMKSM